MGTTLVNFLSLFFLFVINNFLSSPSSSCSFSLNPLGLARSSSFFGWQTCGCDLGDVRPFHPPEALAPWKRGLEARVQTDLAFFKAIPRFQDRALTSVALCRHPL